MTQPNTALTIDDFRARIEKAKDGRQMLSILTDDKRAQELIPQLSVDDLYVCLQMVGVEDSESVLALATGTQVQGLVDVDGWQRDRILPERIQPWLQGLMRAGPEVLTRRLLDLDDALLTYLVRHHVDAFMVEDPDDFEPPSEMHVFTPDRQTCLVFKTDQDQSLPIRIFLDTLMKFDAAHCLNLLAHLNATLTSNLEEQSYRWRSGRLADRGYIDYYEALKIYAPLPKGYQHNRPKVVDGFSASLKSKALMRWRKGDAPLARAVAVLDHDSLQTFHYETALASNMALSADRVELWDTGSQYQVLQRVRNGIQLGLLVRLGTNASAEALASHLKKHGAIELFRVGYQATIDAAKHARMTTKRNRFRTPAGATAALDIPTLETWTERLTQRHPHLGDGQHPSTLEELELLRLWSTRIAQVGIMLDNRPMEQGAICWLWTQFLRHELGCEDRLTNAELTTLLNQIQTGSDSREALAERFGDWWAAGAGELDAQLAELVFESTYDELIALARSDLPEGATLQFIILES